MKLDQEQEKLLALIRRIWKGNPSLRFFQLLGNCFKNADPGDMYYITDNQLLDDLRWTYNHALAHEESESESD